MMRPPFPTVLDSSLMSCFKACPQKFYREYMQHWKPAHESVHLVAGAAFAAGLEAGRIAFFEKNADPERALELAVEACIKSYGNYECPPDSPKSLVRMLGALEFYFDQYPLDKEHATPVLFGSGRRGIEFNFAVPTDLINPETGEPVLYCGRLDQIVDFSGMVFGEDDKTTGQLGASWPRKWDMRYQFSGYAWGCREAGHPLSGFLVRGVSILKRSYETLEAITYRPEWEVDRWYAQFLRDGQRMVECWKSGFWDYDMNDACTAYGGCMFVKICKNRDPEPWLQTSFQRREWNPLTRVERVLDANDV